MRRTLQIVFLIVICLSLTNCFNRRYIRMDDLQSIDKKMTRDEIIETLPYPLRAMQTFQYENTTYTILNYRMQVSTDAKPMVKMDVATGQPGVTSQSVVLWDDYYLLLNSNDELIYWGFLHEFSEAKETLIQNLGKVMEFEIRKINQKTDERFYTFNLKDERILYGKIIYSSPELLFIGDGKEYFELGIDKIDTIQYQDQDITQRALKEGYGKNIDRKHIAGSVIKIK